MQHPAAEIHAAVLAARRVDADSTPIAIPTARLQAARMRPSTTCARSATQAPVIKLVNVLILDALKANASDIHLEAAADAVRVRFRLDGVLTTLVASAVGSTAKAS